MSQAIARAEIEPVHLMSAATAPGAPTPEDLREVVLSLRSDVERGGSQRGRLSPRERIDLLLDDESFVELDRFARRRAVLGTRLERPHTDGVVCGWGTVEGRVVVVVAHDSRIFGGSLGEVFAMKVHKAQELAIRVGAPLVAINDGGGARIQEGVSALDGYGGVFERNVRASGVIPQVSVVLGACAGGAAYSPALTDFVFTVAGLSELFITGPDVVRAVTGETVGRAELGGAGVHAAVTGVATFIAPDEATCLADVRHLLAHLPSNNLEAPPLHATADDPERSCPELRSVLPERRNVAYDIRAVLHAVLDDGALMECHEHWARNVVCGLGTIGGRVVGVVANQPAVLAGALDIDASEKAARFVRTCDAFNVPLVTFVDTPGFLPGLDQEHGAIIRHGAKLLYAYCDASVPRIQVILRKAYGGAYIVMESRSVGADIALAWPTAEVAVMGAEAAVDLLHRREIAASADPDERRRQLVEVLARETSSPFPAAERGMVDDVIDPADTRRLLHRSLCLLETKREVAPHRRHGNIPL